MPGLEPVGVISAPAATPSAFANASMSALGIAKQVLSLPGRLYTRIRLIDDLLQQDAEVQAAAIAERYRLANPDVELPMRNRHLTMPGPWAFFMSHYAIAVIMLMFLLNRIQNVVVPLRQSRYDTSRLPWYRRIFPLDMSSTKTRTILRLPTMVLCLRALLLWTVVTSQVAGFFPGWKILEPLGDWAARMPMEDVSWTVFISVVAAIAVASFARGLEGHTHLGNSQPFNVVGFAFTHQLYSQTVNHDNQSEDLPSRPNKHVLIMMLIPLIQLTAIHIMGASRRVSRERLIPTAICSLLNLAHYHYVLWLSPTTYPLVNIAPGAVDTCLIAIIALTASLRALGELCTIGTIRGPLLGHADAVAIRRNEDFGLMLLRIGTTALDATAAAGLGNALVAVPAPPRAGVHLTHAAAEMPAHTGAAGFGNEIRSVHAKNVDNDGLGATSPFAQELLAFGDVLLRIARGSARWAWAFISRRPLPVPPAPSNSVPSPAQAVTPRIVARARSTEPSSYTRFLSQDLDADDEVDLDFDPAGYVRVSSTAPLSDSDSDEHQHVDDDDEDDEVAEDEQDVDDASGLYTDPPPADVLLAHLTSPQAGPLTRGRFMELVPTYLPGPADSSVIRRRHREETPTPALPTEHKEDDAGPPMCVVCASSPRDVILWPCRCLAMCDDCRANLASRAAASRHACPCCRQHVEGYSRIYIP